LYFNFSSASFCTTFLSAGIATSISLHVCPFIIIIIIMFSRHMFSRENMSHYKITWRRTARFSVHQCVTRSAVVSI
jgi:hypothetical protein